VALPKAKRAVVFGGGIAGLTAAHELAERGFTVTLYEASSYLGGRARTQWKLDRLRLPCCPIELSHLPGEHGFRLFPSFYRHVIDTMRRIPIQPSVQSKIGVGAEVEVSLDLGTVADHLVATEESALALGGGVRPIRYRNKPTHSILQVMESLLALATAMRLDAIDLFRFELKVLKFLTSSDARRLNAYEGETWWNFLDGDKFSPHAQRFLLSIPETLVAMDARHGSARTNGALSMQHFLDATRRAEILNRVLDGPTSTVWFEPWEALLKGAYKVDIKNSHALTALQEDGPGIAAVVTDHEGNVDVIRASSGSDPIYIVCALPFVAMQDIVRASGLVPAVIPELAPFLDAAPGMATARMTGIQFFLDQDVPIAPGHIYCPDTKWLLSLVSHRQFWRQRHQFHFSAFAEDLTSRGVLSVILGTWDVPGLSGRRPSEYNETQQDAFADEVWNQLRAAIGTIRDEQGRFEIELPSDRPPYHIDTEIEFGASAATVRTPHVIHPPGFWNQRPNPSVLYGGNLSIIGDYVQTETDLATMEGANESARWAVNAIVSDLARRNQNAGGQAKASFCGVWRLEEPYDLEPLKIMDQWLFEELNAPHFLEILGFEEALDLVSHDPVSASAVVQAAVATAVAGVDAALKARIMQMLAL